MNWLPQFALTILADAAPAAQAADAATENQPPIQGPANAFLQFLPWIAIFVFAYFILLRPQSQEAKKRENLLSSLKKDDRVVTIGGIIGTVANISANGKEVTLKMEDNSKIRFLRTAIQTKLTAEDASAEAPAS